MRLNISHQNHNSAETSKVDDYDHYVIGLVNRNVYLATCFPSVVLLDEHVLYVKLWYEV